MLSGLAFGFLILAVLVFLAVCADDETPEED